MYSMSVMVSLRKSCKDAFEIFANCGKSRAVFQQRQTLRAKGPFEAREALGDTLQYGTVDQQSKVVID